MALLKPDSNAEPSSPGGYGVSGVGPTPYIAPTVPGGFVPDQPGGWVYKPQILPINPGIFPGEPGGPPLPKPCATCVVHGGPNIGPIVPKEPIAPERLSEASLGASSTTDAKAKSFPWLLLLLALGVVYLVWDHNAER